MAHHRSFPPDPSEPPPPLPPPTTAEVVAIVACFLVAIGIIAYGAGEAVDDLIRQLTPVFTPESWTQHQ